MTDVILRASGLAKRFGATVALDDVGLELRRGEMLALVGANGAGKSTLVKIVCGAVAADRGTLEIAGTPVHFRGVADAMAAGIAVAHQQVAIIPPLTGAENILLGREPLRGGLIDHRAIRAQAKALADRFGVRIELDRPCAEMGLGERKILDILKAMATGPRILILDEPTASLTLAETARLFSFLADLRRDGLGILFISHHLAEVFNHCDRVVVLKDGRRVHEGAVADVTLPELVHLMIGRRVQDAAFASHAVAGETVLDIRDYQVGSLRLPELVVRRGEVVGLAGVLGAGQTECLERLAGVPHPATAGSVRLGALRRLPRDVAEAVAQGIVLVADDRLRKAVLRGLSVEENLSAGALDELSVGGFMRGRMAFRRARDTIAGIGIKAAGPRQDVGQLSGGNQQKVAFGRWLSRTRPATLLLLDNPTEGVDVASKADLYGLIREVARRGAGVLVSSTEFSELAAICDRVYCIAGGAATHCLPREDLSETRLLLEVA